MVGLEMILQVFTNSALKQTFSRFSYSFLSWIDVKQVELYNLCSSNETTIHIVTETKSEGNLNFDSFFFLSFFFLFSFFSLFCDAFPCKIYFLLYTNLNLD